MGFLEEIVESTAQRIEATRRALSQEQLDEMVAEAPPPRGFAVALTGAPNKPALIAEIKRSTPSTGDLAPGADVAAQARAYAAGGATAVSVLTEPHWFKGTTGDMHAARAADLPLLRKDFTLDPFQVQESRAAGADAVLLIVRILSAGALRGLLKLSEQLGMDALVEVFSEGDLEQALSVGARLIGVNQRDLSTFEIDRDRTAKLAPLIPPDVTLVSLSGIEGRDDVVTAGDAGAHAVLVGSALMRASDPEGFVRELVGS
jgi:indole-3-glycerol phosphate synthase